MLNLYVVRVEMVCVPVSAPITYTMTKCARDGCHSFEASRPVSLTCLGAECRHIPSDSMRLRSYHVWLVRRDYRYALNLILMPSANACNQ